MKPFFWYFDNRVLRTNFLIYESVDNAIKDPSRVFVLEEILFQILDFIVERRPTAAGYVRSID